MKKDKGVWEHQKRQNEITDQVVLRAIKGGVANVMNLSYLRPEIQGRPRWLDNSLRRLKAAGKIVWNGHEWVPMPSKGEAVAVADAATPASGLVRETPELDAKPEE